MNFEELMEYYRPNQITYNQMKKNENNIVPFVGAGLSAFNYKQWVGVLKELNSFLPKQEEEIANRFIINHKYEEAADVIYKALGVRQFYSQLRELFDEKIIDDNKLRSEAVALLPYLFSGQCLTTNFDKVIEHSYSTSGKSCNISFPDDDNRLNSALQGASGNLLFKIHGDLYSNNKDIVFSGESYDRHYKEDFPLVGKLKKWMQSRHMCFLGCSLEKDRTMDILRLVCEEGIDHYAIVGCPEDKIKERKEELEEKGILAVFYPEGKHECVRIVLEKLLEETNPEQYAQLPFYINMLPELYNRFQYQARKTELLGRDEELKKLKEFLMTDVPLSCWAVTGKGGAGKSRLVYEFGQQPPAGWKVCYIKSYEYEQLKTKYLTASKNTLYILDYVQAYIEEIGEWVRCLLEAGKTSRIRILLVERDDIKDGKASWLDRLKDSVGISRLRKIIYLDKMLQLDKIKDPSVVIQIMQSYAKNNEASLEYSTGEELYNILLKIDKDHVRPLYAMLITDAYINGEKPLHWSEEEVLRYFNDREIDRIDDTIKAVFKRKKENNHKFYLAVYNLLLMATSQGGLVLPGDAKRLCSTEWEYLTEMITGDEDELCERIYRAQLALPTGKGTGRYVIPPILPDIMGEFFVWEQFSSENFERIDHDMWMRRNICQMWENEEKGFSFFLRLLIDHKGLIKREEDKMHLLLFPWEEDISTRLSVKNGYGQFLVVVAYVMEDDIAQFIIKNLEEVYDKLRTSESRRVLASIYMNNIVKQEEEGINETIERLKELFKEDPEEIRVSLAQSLLKLAAKQELEGMKKTIGRLEKLYVEDTEDKIQIMLAQAMSILGSEYYELHFNSEAADYFYKASEMGNVMAGINLAYMIRRGEVSEFNNEYVITLLDRAEEEGLSLINRALYYIQNLGGKGRWKKADNCFAALKASSKEELNGVISWWGKCYQNTDTGKCGELDRREGCIVLAFLMHHGLMKSDKECQAQVYSYYPEAPEWLKEKCR